jgi:hypothetical protein
MNTTAPLPNVLLRMWSVYPVLVPFYLMGKTPIPGTEKVEGGVPQIADYYLAGLMVLVFGCLPFKLKRPAIPVVVALACFVIYTLCVNLVWAVGLEDLSLLKSSIFYTYDAMLLLTCLVLYAHFKDAFLLITLKSVGASVVLQALLSPLAPHSQYSRQALFFNNENQLGYFCLLAATVFVVGARQIAIRLPYQLVFYTSVAYLALLAQSRGALLGLVTLTVIALLGRPVRLLLVLGMGALLYVALTGSPPMLSKAEERYVVSGEYDTAATRGYDRIVNYPEHLLFGAGEGAYERFRSELYASEIHSSYGTVLFCYGIPGTVLFLLVLWAICRPDLRVAIYLIPAFVHSSGHHGLRFAFFWAMLAFLCCQATAAAADVAEPVATELDALSDDAAATAVQPKPAR